MLEKKSVYGTPIKFEIFETLEKKYFVEKK